LAWSAVKRFLAAMMQNDLNAKTPSRQVAKKRVPFCAGERLLSRLGALASLRL
jgi:hypothetical protein